MHPAPAGRLKQELFLTSPFKQRGDFIMAERQLLREAGRGKLKQTGLLLPLNLLRGRSRRTKHWLWLFMWPEQGMVQRLLQCEMVAPTSPSSHLRETEARGGGVCIKEQVGGPNPRSTVAADFGL